MNRKLALIAGLLLMVPFAAFAGEQANAPTVSGETGLFTIISGDTIPKGEWSFGLYASNWDRLTLDEYPQPGNGTDHVGIDWTRLSASVGYGLTDRWEVSLMVPYDDFSRGNPLSDESGLGNVRVGTKFRLFGAAGDDSRLALHLFVEPRTSSSDMRNAVVAGNGGFGGGLGWSKSNWTINLDYRDPGNEVELETSVGVGYAGSVSERLDWITELVGTYYRTGEIQQKDALDLTSGGRLWFGADGRWAFNFALRADMLELQNFDKRCPIGGVLGLTYFPRFGRKAVAPVPAPAPAPAPPPPPPAPEPTPAPAPPAPEPPPAPAPVEQREVINFTPNSARLSNIAKAKLDEVALKMKQDPSLTAEVLGYTDSKGSEKSNQRLSQQRADAVKTYLMKRHGLDGSRISSSGKSSTDPVSDNATDAGRAANRRAVIVLKLQ